MRDIKKMVRLKKKFHYISQNFGTLPKKWMSLFIVYLILLLGGGGVLFLILSDNGDSEVNNNNNYLSKIIITTSDPLISSSSSSSSNDVSDGPNGDQESINNLRLHYLREPSKEPYNLTGREQGLYTAENFRDKNFNPSGGQVQVLHEIFRKMSPGFFLDCGANDGVFLSNSLWLERRLGWTGLLIEGDPQAYDYLVNVHRKAWTSQSCLSVQPYPVMATFYTAYHTEASGLIKSKYYGATTPVKVQCFPLHMFLTALNRTTIDYFSLDVEGSELDILTTVPFDRIQFKVLTIEHLFVRGGKFALRNFMEFHGYIFYRTIVNGDVGDSVFLHPSVLPLLSPKEFRQMNHQDREKKVAGRKWR